MNYENIVSKIESLPPLSDTMMIVQKLYSEGAENVEIKKLIKAIESDAILAANILKMINSPLYGFSKQIVSIAQAVTLFGTELIFGLVVRYSIKRVIIANLRAYGRSNDLFNEICHLQSTLVSEWYSNVHIERAKFLVPLALIMESGKLILAQEVTQSGNLKEFCHGLKKVENISVYENENFQTSSYYVSGLLFEHWNFNQTYVEILKGLDFEHPPAAEFREEIDILDVVRTAVNVKDIFTQESVDKASFLVEDMKLDVDSFREAVDKINAIHIKRNII